MSKFIPFYKKHLKDASNHSRNEYVALPEIEANDLEDVFFKMQGEVWSPHGEARDLILSLGLHHTSMSINDIVYDVEADKYWLVGVFGFLPLEDF